MPHLEKELPWPLPVTDSLGLGAIEFSLSKSVVPDPLSYSLVASLKPVMEIDKASLRGFLMICMQQMVKTRTLDLTFDSICFITERSSIVN